MIKDENLKFYIEQAFREYKFDMRLYSRVEPLDFEDWLAKKVETLFPAFDFNKFKNVNKIQKYEVRQGELFDMEEC